MKVKKTLFCGYDPKDHSGHYFTVGNDLYRVVFPYDQREHAKEVLAKYLGVGPVIIKSAATLPNVRGKYGAPMGRRSARSIGGEIVIAPVPMEDAYDVGGAYWGLPQNLFVAQSGDGSTRFYRADSFSEVEETIMKEMGREKVYSFERGVCIFV